MQKESLFREKLKILYEELRIVQNTIDKYDGIMFQIRGWEVSVWSALMIIALEFNKIAIIYLAILVPLIFWSFDGTYKTYRVDYTERRSEITGFLNSQKFEDSFKRQKLGFKTPVLPTHEQKDMFKHMFKPHIFLLHLALSLLAIIALVILI
jgi:hypothetical protein